MKVKVINLFQDKYTQEIHKPNEEIEVNSSIRVKELMAAGVIEPVEIPDPKEKEEPKKEPVKKKATTTTKRAKKNE